MTSFQSRYHIFVTEKRNQNTVTTFTSPVNIIYRIFLISLSTVLHLGYTPKRHFCHFFFNVRPLVQAVECGPFVGLFGVSPRFSSLWSFFFGGGERLFLGQRALQFQREELYFAFLTLALSVLPPCPKIVPAPLA